VLVFVLLAGSAGFGAWRWVSARDEQVCSACQRVIHAGSRTVASDGHRERAFCCPACALAERELTGPGFSVTSLTDFETGRPLPPASAFVVRASEVNPCVHAQGAVSEDKRPLRVLYDRCSPSLIAFASHQSATTFARQHGGTVVPFTALSSTH
jgi:hypothetical protein